MLNEQEISQLIDLCRKAGMEIMKIYSEPSKFGVEIKDDNSPLTLADQASHRIISEGLKSLFPSIPILSEEGKDISFEERKSWSAFWMVDPLDGTKEFIKRNDEFTINVALIEDNITVFGIVYLPVWDTAYWGGKAYGAFKLENSESPIHIRNRNADRVAMRSRSHAAPEEQEVYDRYKVTEFRSAGSALKFCYVAEGKADLYYRHGPTMEWDTAAGQAVLEGAGGKVLEGTGPEEFRYNKEILRNGPFLCLGFDQ